LTRETRQELAALRAERQRLRHGISLAERHDMADASEALETRFATVVESIACLERAEVLAIVGSIAPA
jgi:hypothetical protein